MAGNRISDQGQNVGTQSDGSSSEQEAGSESEESYNSDDSACVSSDVTWGASDLETAGDMWANDFDSNATYPDDCEPFYDLER